MKVKHEEESKTHVEKVPRGQRVKAGKRHAEFSHASNVQKCLVIEDHTIHTKIEDDSQYHRSNSLHNSSAFGFETKDGTNLQRKAIDDSKIISEVNIDSG